MNEGEVRMMAVVPPQLFLLPAIMNPPWLHIWCVCVKRGVSMITQ